MLNRYILSTLGVNVATIRLQLLDPGEDFFDSKACCPHYPQWRTERAGRHGKNHGSSPLTRLLNAKLQLSVRTYQWLMKATMANFP